MSDVAERTPEIAARAHDVSMLSELEVAGTMLLCGAWWNYMAITA